MNTPTFAPDIDELSDSAISEPQDMETRYLQSDFYEVASEVILRLRLDVAVPWDLEGIRAFMELFYDKKRQYEAGTPNITMSLYFSETEEKLLQALRRAGGSGDLEVIGVSNLSENVDVELEVGDKVAARSDKIGFADEVLKRLHKWSGSERLSDLKMMDRIFGAMTARSLASTRVRNDIARRLKNDAGFFEKRKAFSHFLKKASELMARGADAHVVDLEEAEILAAVKPKFERAMLDILVLWHDELLRENPRTVAFEQHVRNALQSVFEEYFEVTDEQMERMMLGVYDWCKVLDGKKNDIEIELRSEYLAQEKEKFAKRIVDVCGVEMVVGD